ELMRRRDVQSAPGGIEGRRARRRRHDRRRRNRRGAAPLCLGQGSARPYVKALARNLATKNIRANMVSRGNVYFKGGVWNVLEENNPELFQTMVGRNPMGRMGTPEEVANAVVFLASRRASFVTGTNLIVDGALTQRVQF